MLKLSRACRAVASFARSSSTVADGRTIRAGPVGRGEPLRERGFVDRLVVRVRGGDGGRGAISFWSNRNRRGADGGCGGHGGSVWVEADSALHCLRNVRQAQAASCGGAGSRHNGRGKHGADLVVPVPCGTLVTHATRGLRVVPCPRAMLLSPDQCLTPPQVRAASPSELALGETDLPPTARLVTAPIVADLATAGQRVMLACGGRGGRGNAILRPPPPKRGPVAAWTDREWGDVAEPGTPGARLAVLLELKALADVGLVGAPNAGKSTLLRSLTAATPAVAPYPFTTLRPQLGRLSLPGEEGSEGVGERRAVTLADIPGLVAGAAAGRGLGAAFLRHVERARVLAYVIDLSAGAVGGSTSGGGDLPPAEQLEMLRAEVGSHNRALLDRPSLVVATKTDAPGAARALAGLKVAVAGALPIVSVCAPRGQGLDELCARIDALCAMKV